MVDLRIAPHAIWRDVEGELAILDGRDETYHELNASAAAIWRAIAAGESQKAIIRRLSDRFGVAHDIISEEVEAFIDKALKIGLIEPVDPAP